MNPEQTPTQPQTPGQIVAEMRRERLITDLRFAIERMADGYAAAFEMASIAPTGSERAWAARAAVRRKQSLRRLTAALANLAGGAR